MRTGDSKGGLRYWMRVLRPLSWWVLLVLVLLGIRTHQRLMRDTRIEFSVKLQGQPSLYSADATLDGHPIADGQNISLGNHTFAATSPKNDPFQAQFFAWYGPHPLGEITLRRSLGTLHIHAVPPAASVVISGPEVSATLRDVNDTNVSLPTDTYTLTASYAHWSESQNVAVYANQMASSTFSPHLGALHLTCNMEDTAFILQTRDGQRIEDGNIPATVSDLLAGDYYVTATYRNRKIQRSAKVEAGATNEVPLNFIFGAARIDSNPEGASVNAADGTYLGLTPLDLSDLPAQTTTFTLSLAEYEPVSLAMKISAGKTNECSTNLLNIHFVSAMEGARSSLVIGNYEGAAKDAAQALAVNPDDADALAIQKTANAALTDQQKQHEVELDRLAQLNRPREVFDAVCSKDPDVSLFSEHELKTGKPAEEVEEAIVKSLQNGSPAFQIVSDSPIEKETYEIMAKHELSLGILGGSERDCLVVVGQTKPGETEIFYRVLEYQISHTLVDFHDVKQRTPVALGRTLMTEIQNMQIQNGLRIVADRISKAIAQP